MQSPLPPGQYESDEFPRFGITRFANRFPTAITNIEIVVSGSVGNEICVGESIHSLERVEQASDFHCVTTWSRRGLNWGGFRFCDFYRSIVVPEARPDEDATYVIMRGQDGARSSLPLADLLAPDVLLADTLGGRPLAVEHGAPIRIVAPHHYGYKSVKHLCRIEFWRDDSNFRPSAFRFMDHPRARVKYEERGIGFPGWMLRYLYRPLVGPTIRRFRTAMLTRPEQDQPSGGDTNVG